PGQEGSQERVRPAVGLGQSLGRVLAAGQAEGEPGAKKEAFHSRHQGATGKASQHWGLWARPVAREGRSQGKASSAHRRSRGDSPPTGLTLPPSAWERRRPRRARRMRTGKETALPCS